MTPTLTTDRLILRRPVPCDWDAYRDFCLSDRADVFPSLHGDPFGAFQGFAATLGMWEMRGHGLWAVTRKGDDRILGLIGPYTPETWPETEIGWIILDPAVEGTGIAFEAAQAAIRDAYTRLGWTTVVHYIRPDNHRSIALAERLGSRRDPAAAMPFPDKPGGVWRHPGPEVVQ